ncbi:TetR/AcrR family transcriptional regulator [Nocardia stercoris]|uniref:TetR/AcrR family transcriptional regulator n=1 Tax=Nocardia stercoris TaxID=2483361 RepID=A0A3M2KTC1_9NOCA|nr:TetR/AcrR family transcriptional regulator [Nocardia stercoris]RMI28709.1 TetR/AcrR family transcriptional regulator [Nocardia stercoris]
MTEPGTPRPAAVRDAVLAAAVQVLTESGYAATSVRAVARRAGVSQGALQHHFRSKADLVAAALAHLAGELSTYAARELGALRGTPREQAETLLNRLWEIHTLPVSETIVEILSLARKDPDLAARMTPVLDTAHTLTLTAGANAAPELAARDGFDQWLLACVATMRGLVVVHDLDAATTPDWPQARRILLRAFDLT